MAAVCCCMCKADMDDNVVLFRVNSRSEPSRWACAKHFNEAVELYRNKKDPAHADDTRK